MPYQATAINPRMIAGMFAPNTPNEIRDATGYGVPVACDGRATRLHRKYTMVMPTNNAISTCHAANPNANRLPAVTYPPTLCTSDIQNAKKLYEVHVCLLSGARSSFVSRGAYPGLITPAPAACSGVMSCSETCRWCSLLVFSIMLLSRRFGGSAAALLPPEMDAGKCDPSVAAEHSSPRPTRQDISGPAAEIYPAPFTGNDHNPFQASADGSDGQLQGV